jgi:hypothetical protein
VFRCIEQRRHEVWVPRVMKLAWFLRIFFPGLFRRGAARFDPVPREVIQQARRGAAGSSAREVDEDR